MRFLSIIGRERLLVLLVLLAVLAMFVSPLMDLPETALRAARRLAILLCAILLLAQTIVRLLRRPGAVVASRPHAVAPVRPPVSPLDLSDLLGTVVLLC